MEFDAKAAADALLREDGGTHSSAPDRERLEAALRAAYEQGCADCRRTTRPREASLHEIFFRELMQSIPDLIYFKDSESHFLAVNPAHAASFGRTPEELIGKSDFDLFKEDDAHQKFEDEQEIIRRGEGFAPRVEHEFKSDGSESWALSTKHPWRDTTGAIRGTFGLSRNITEQTIAERALAEQHELLETLVDVMPCRIFVRDREHRFRLVNDQYRRSLGATSKEEVIGLRFCEIVEDPRTKAIMDEDETVMRTGVPILNRVDFDTSPIEVGKWFSLSKVPIRNLRGEIEGIVGVAFDISPQKQAEARARVVTEELAHKHLQIERELALARKLQVALATFRFPEQLTVSPRQEVRAAYLYEPSEHLAGDFFQLFPLDDHCFAAFICDVMGHGVRSALVTAVIRGLLEENRGDLTSPARLFERINQVLFRLAQDPDFPRFVTAVLAFFDTQSGHLEVVNAGHPPPLCLAPREEALPPEERVTEVDAHRNPALGLIEHFAYRSTRLQLRENASYLFYTDGLLEQEGENGQEFAQDGIRETLLNTPTNKPNQLIQYLRVALAAHAGNQSFADDVCAMALSVRRT